MALIMTTTIHDGVVTVTTSDRVHKMTVATIAAWGELLGYTNTSDIIDAIMHVAEHGEPEPDPDSGENAWTPAYEAVTADAQHTALAVANGPMLRPALLNMGLDAGRTETRLRLGLPSPGVQARGMRAMTTTVDPWQELKTVVAEHEPEIAAARHDFIVSLSPLTQPTE